MKHTSDILENPASITHLTGASNYTWFHFCNGSKVMLSKPLSAFEALLPSFVRIHKTALVNPGHVKQVHPPHRTKAPGSVLMPGDVVLPISRRRWLDVADVLQAHMPEDQLTTTDMPETEPSHSQLERPEKPAKQGIALPTRQVYAFVRDEMKGVLIRQKMAEKWPHCTLRFFANGASLMEHLTQTASRELPVLVLLDVRTVGWAGLSTLEYIKSDKRLRLIPTVLFIDNQSGNDIEVCYAAGANSVIPQPVSYADFAATIERICTYWLSFAALPEATLINA